jgi:anti-sigma B factor antagonist
VPVDDPEFSASVVRDGSAPIIEHGGRVVLDLTATTFVDSTGLAVLVAAHRRAERLGGRVVVVNVDPEIARLLKITGLDTILATAPDRDGALGLLG